VEPRFVVFRCSFEGVKGEVDEPPPKPGRGVVVNGRPAESFSCDVKLRIAIECYKGRYNILKQNGRDVFSERAMI
jgi:hypothetical protein